MEFTNIKTIQIRNVWSVMQVVRSAKEVGINSAHLVKQEHFYITMNVCCNVQIIIIVKMIQEHALNVNKSYLLKI